MERGRNGYFAPYEYAAMLSAAYDGHGGTMGPAMGAKAADASFPVIHSGLAGVALAPDYFEGVRLWASAFRPKQDFPADVLNVHAYCRNPQGTAGVAPEACPLEADLARLCAYRDASLPSVPIWLTEYGYDTVGGPSHAPPIGAASSQEVQGQWLLRLVLLLERLPSPGSGGACVSRSHMYMLADVESTSGGVFATSGLLASPAFAFASKPSWWFYRAVFAALANATYAGMVAVPGAPAGVMAQCFTFRGAGGGYSLVVWSGTATGVSLPGTAVPVATAACPVAAPGASLLTLITPSVGAAEGNRTVVPVAGLGAAATALLTVTELPVILMAA